MPNKLTTKEIASLNETSPVGNILQFGDFLADVEEETIFVYKFEVDSDATTPVTALTAPFDLELVGFSTISMGQVASATVKALRGGSNDITDALSIASIRGVSRAASIDGTYSEFAKGEILQVQTNGASDVCLCYFFCRKI